MPLSPFSLPAPLAPGETAISLLTTHGYVSYVGDSGTGTLTVGPSSGEIDRWHSSGIGDLNGPGRIAWDTLPSLPISQSLVTKIYIAGIVNFNGQLGFQYVTVPPIGTGLFISPGTVPYSGQGSLLIASGPAAHTFDLSSLWFEMKNEASLNITIAPPGDVMTLSAIGVILYYPLSAIPIGHAANCNAYSPLGLGDGATTAPGNGRLISV